VGVRRQRDRLHHLALALHGGEDEVGAAGVEGQDDAGSLA
jgi:hypothetical protein